MAFTDIIAQLAVSLDMDSGGFVRKTHEAGKAADQMGRNFEGIGGKIRGAGSQLGSFAAGVAGAAAALGSGAIVQAAGNAIRSAAALGSMAQQLGVAASELQKFRLIGKQLGVDQGDLDDAIRTLTQTVGKAATGSKSAFAVFDQLGIQIRDAAGNIRPTAVIMTEVAGALQRIPDPATRAALAVQLFGEEGQRIAPLLNQGAEGIKRLGDEAARTGKIISDADIAKAQELQRKYDDVATTVQTRFTTAVVTGADFLSKLNSKLTEGSDKLRALDAQLGVPTPSQFFDSIAANSAASAARLDKYAADVAAGMKSLGASVAGIAPAFESAMTRAEAATAKMATRVREWLTTKLAGAWATIKQKSAEAGNDFYRLYDRVVGNSYVPDMVEGIRAEMAKLDGAMVAPAAKATQSAGDAFKDLQSKVAGLLSQLFPEEAKTNRLLEDVALLDAAMRAGAISADTYAAALAKVTANAGMTRDGLRDVPIFGDPEGDQKGVVDQANSDIAAAMGQWQDSLDRDMARPAEEKTAMIAEAFAGMAQDVIGSIQSMVQSFKSGDILGGLQGILDLIGQVTGLLGSLGVKLPGNAPIAGARANGGPVVPGRTYLVGERGPEFITPRRSGYVHPNGSGGGGAVTVHVEASPYFDARVEDRAGRVAAPLAGRAAIMGAGGAEARAAQRQRRAIP